MKNQPHISGLIAILRGLTPAEAPAVGTCLYEAGFRTIEVPLNSPSPLDSITALRGHLPGDCVVGAGTVLRVGDVRRCHQAGAGIIVAPNMNAEVIAETAHLGMESFPGVATPTEALAALDAGATGLKLFPAGQVGTAGLSAWRAVLPPGTPLVPVGGVALDDFDAWLDAGATGFGIGSNLYRPGISAESLAERARSIASAWASASTARSGK